MEMPTPCENCGEIFDLNDGRRSPRKRNIVICESCAEKEQEEIDREEEIILLREQIGEAEDTLICAKERLRKLGAERQIEEIADAGLTEQAELAALREKLAATEASLAERGRMLETTNRVQRSYRAAVAAALAELRAKLDVIRFFEQHKTQDDAMQAVTECVDAVIAKLDLQERQ